MTANAFEDDRRRCLEAGMDGYVAKPISAQSIRDEITRVWSALEKIRPCPPKSSQGLYIRSAPPHCASSAFRH